MLVAALGLAGCVAFRSPIVLRSTQAEAYTEAELRADLIGFAGRFDAAVSATADRVAEATDRREIRKRTLEWKLRVIPLVHQTVLLDDPQEAFAATLLLTVSMREYFAHDEGPEAFAELQALAIEATRELEADLLQIGARFLSRAELARSAAEVEAYARAHPTGRTEFTSQRLQRDVATLGQHGVIATVINAPMAPFRALEGVSSGADAIREFNRTAEEFAQIVAGLPRLISWETQLLLYDVEDRATVVDGVETFRSIGESIGRVSDAVDRLPDDFAAALADSRGALADADRTLASARALLEPLAATVEQIKQASAIWAELLAGEDAPAAGRPFDVREWESALRETGVAADRLHGLAAEIGVLADSERLDGAVRELTATVERTEARARGVVDLAAWRGVQLLVAFFVLLLAYRLIAARIGRPGP